MHSPRTTHSTGTTGPSITKHPSNPCSQLCIHHCFSPCKRHHHFSPCWHRIPCSLALDPNCSSWFLHNLAWSLHQINLSVSAQSGHFHLWSPWPSMGQYTVSLEWQAPS